MRICNVDSISAYLDRLIVERIKWYFFVKNDQDENALHQESVINEIKSKLIDLMTEDEYVAKAEKRTFANEFLVDLDSLIKNNIHIGESDRTRLAETKSPMPDVNVFITQEKRLRTANEGRAANKNDIEHIWRKIVNGK